MKLGNTFTRLVAGCVLITTGLAACDSGQQNAADRSQESQEVAEAQREANEKMAEARRELEESRAEAKKEFIDAQSEVEKEKAEANTNVRPINPQDPAAPEAAQQQPPR